MQLAVKGCTTPHPKESWSLNSPPLSTRATPRQPLGPSTVGFSQLLNNLRSSSGSAEPITLCLSWAPVVRCRWPAKQRLFEAELLPFGIGERHAVSSDWGSGLFETQQVGASR